LSSATLFSYTTLFRSGVDLRLQLVANLKQRSVLRAKLVDDLGEFQPERFAVHPGARKGFLVGKIIKRLGYLEPVDFNPITHSISDRKSTRLNSSHVKI